MIFSIVSETCNAGEERRGITVPHSKPQSPNPFPNFQVMVTNSLALLFSCRFRFLGTPAVALQPLLLNLWILQLAFPPVLPTLSLPLFPPPQ